MKAYAYTCPSGKRGYAGKRAAKLALKAEKRGGGVPKNGHERNRYVYACPLCPWWHLTSQAQR